MKLPVALGIALAAFTVAGASAYSNSRHVIVRGGHSAVDIDANEDGWITRAEASSAFERIYGDLDSNDDGRLDDQDRREFNIHIDGPDVQVLEGGNGRRVRVIRNGEEVEVDEEEIEREVERAMEEAERHIERAEREAERAEREAERAEREAERVERDVERRVQRHIERHGDRDVIIIHRDGDADVMAVAPAPPVPPIPPIPAAPHFMMLIANSEEADLNSDGALSLDEFRNQHLRFFDASDANGDGRIRFEEPPEPPAPPAPPEPPRRR